MNIKQNIMRTTTLFTFGLLALFLFACQEAEEHDHAEEEITVSHTVWTEKSELFVEFEPLIVGELTLFLAHFSDMETFHAVEKGELTVSLTKGTNGIRNTVSEPSSPGIFTPSLQPKEAGVYTLTFELTTPTFSDKIIIEDVTVYATHAAAEKAIGHEEENPNEIGFLKEQAWKIEFANAPVTRDTVHEIINTGGQILPAQGDEKVITATTSGIVVYNSTRTMIGSEVSSGQLLFSVIGGNMTDHNVKTHFLQAKSNYTQAKSNYDRKQKLYNSKAISKADYEEAQLAFQLAESEYQNLASNYGNGGKSIKSPSMGYIKHLYKTEGEFVEAGEPLAVITQNKRLTIQANVGQKDYTKLNSAISANFLFNGKPYAIEDFNGKLISYGKSVSSEHPKIPVYFELDNQGELLPGSYIEVWIHGTQRGTALRIPTSALLENYGAYSVIVQAAGESFEKRDIKIGVSDGKYVEVISGLEEGERVVTKGAYQVKMASMSGEIPAHSHAH
jgi:RND family efflux transporter MFP subunit